MCKPMLTNAMNVPMQRRAMFMMRTYLTAYRIVNFRMQPIMAPLETSCGNST